MKQILFFLILFFFFVTPINGLTVSGEAVILMDEDSGRILYSKNAHKQKLIASITKIMTAVIAIESNQLDDIVIIDDSILKAYGSNIYIQKGEEITLHALLYGLMLRSGNDAAIAIATYLSGSVENFVQTMNEKANMLGMNRTQFVNPHGLDEDGGNLSTVYDMALLTRYANKLDEYLKIVGTKKKTIKTNYKTYVWHNKNKLLSMYKWTTGGKTGFTEQARRTLVSSASKNNLNLIIVTLNDPNDWVTHQSLYEYGFNNYRNYLVLNSKKINIPSSFYKNKLYVKNNYFYPLKSNELKEVALNAKIVKYRFYKDGDKVGELEVYFNDKLVHKENIYIEKSKKRISKRKSIWQIILSWFKL